MTGPLSISVGQGPTGIVRFPSEEIERLPPASPLPLEDQADDSNATAESASVETQVFTRTTVRRGKNLGAVQEAERSFGGADEGESSPELRPSDDGLGAAVDVMA